MLPSFPLVLFEMVVVDSSVVSVALAGSSVSVGLSLSDPTEASGSVVSSGYTN